MKNITYIFSKGRKQNYLDNTIQAREFYYGLTNFDESNSNIEVIEFSESKSTSRFFFILLDKIMNKFMSLPFSTSKLASIENLKKIYRSDELILVNEGVGFSTLPMLIILRLIRKTRTSLFVMGLYSKEIKFPIFSKMHYLIIKILISYIDNVIFLGKAEMGKAQTLHKKQLNKFHFVPFPVDTDFWKLNNKIDVSKNDKIIFVGNDGNRDYELLVKIATFMKNQNFIIISSNERVSILNQPNIEVIKGKWSSTVLDDEGLKEIYASSKLTIIPLKDSYQPSGQSVALQSMSLGVPVLISRTKGFWNYEDFFNNENIFFVDDNTLESWVDKINLVYKDTTLLKKISESAKKTVTSGYGLNSFYNKLLNLIS